MGVDYRASYGIGYKVHESEEIAETEELEDGLEEYLDCEAGGKFECFSTGNAFQGVVTGTYLTIRDPFKEGLDLTSAKKKLDEEVKRLKLETEGEFGSVGGLYIY